MEAERELDNRIKEIQVELGRDSYLARPRSHTTGVRGEEDDSTERILRLETMVQRMEASLAYERIEKTNMQEKNEFLTSQVETLRDILENNTLPENLTTTTATNNNSNNNNNNNNNDNDNNDDDNEVEEHSSPRFVFQEANPISPIRGVVRSPYKATINVTMMPNLPSSQHHHISTFPSLQSKQQQYYSKESSPREGVSSLVFIS